MTNPSHREGRLAPPTLTLMLAAFGVYFCMYAFRKPITAAEFTGPDFAGTGISLKTAFLVGQVIGYAASKFIGIVLCATLVRERRGWTLVGFILLAEASLCAFAVLPSGWKIVAMFVNGLPLGMVWGLVVRYLEGRRVSDVLLAGLSASLVIASGAVKDVGRYLMSDYGVSESWMPAATAALFLVPFFACVIVLERSGAPDAVDEAARVPRQTMDAQERGAFIRRYGAALVPLLAVYVVLTVYRDFRDNYGVEIFRALGYLDLPGLFTRTELPASLGVLLALASLAWVRDNRRAMAVTYVMMGAGCVSMVVCTFLFRAGLMNGLNWMIVVGVGAYIAYVPVGAVFFDRLIAAGGSAGTAVFGIYVADAAGYTGSVGVQIYRALFAAEGTGLAFMEALTWAVGIAGTLLLVVSYRLLKTALDSPAGDDRPFGY